VYWYQGLPLLLVQVNIENFTISIFYVFTHLITGSNSLTVLFNCLFLLIPAKNLDDTNLVMVDICS
jgi:hypothetical protein